MLCEVSTDKKRTKFLLSCVGKSGEKGKSSVECVKNFRMCEKLNVSVVFNEK